jgi:adenylate cyclase
LFADIRDFTSFSEKQLPYDIIHLLKRYFHLMAKVIERNNGYIYNYMGDGLLALFGVDDPETAPLNGTRAGLEMLEAMAEIQPYIRNTYGQDLDIGVGLHCGDVVIGSIGDAEGEKEMVIGDAVNFASRVESANKKAGTRLLISQPVYDCVKANVKTGKEYSTRLKGIQEEQVLYEILNISIENQ